MGVYHWGALYQQRAMAVSAQSVRSEEISLIRRPVDATVLRIPQRKNADMFGVRINECKARAGV